MRYEIDVLGQNTRENVLHYNRVHSLAIERNTFLDEQVKIYRQLVSLKDEATRYIGSVFDELKGNVSELLSNLYFSKGSRAKRKRERKKTRKKKDMLRPTGGSKYAKKKRRQQEEDTFFY